MKVAAVHHLPTGGAIRVMAEWLAPPSSTEVTVYTRDARVHEFVMLPECTHVVERSLHAGGGVLNEIVRLAQSPREGRKLAGEIDRDGHDVAFCFASRLTQAIDVLPFLRTPSLYYAPEPLRSAYEPCDPPQLTTSLRDRIANIALKSIELRRRRLDRRYTRSARSVVTHSH